MEQAGNLHDPDSPEWEDGYVNLVDGQQMQLWSVFAPAPTLNDGESQVAFMTRRRAAWRNQPGILANRSERAEEARKAHCEVRRTLSRSTSESEKDAQKQNRHAGGSDGRAGQSSGRPHVRDNAES